MENEHITEFAEKLKSSVVIVITFDKSGSPLRGTAGFFLNKKGEVVTNELRDAYSAVVKTSYVDDYPVKGIVAINKLAMKIAIDTKGKETPFLKLCVTLPLEGEQVLVISNPISSKEAVLKGIVSSSPLFPVINNALQIKPVDAKWLEGSPVLNINGQVVGMATSIWLDGGVRNLCVHAKKIINLRRRKIQTLSEWTEARLIKSEIKLARKLARDPYHIGRQIIKNEGYLSALNYFKELAKKRPKGGLFINGLTAECCMHLGYYREAIEAYKKSVFYDSPEIQYNVGLAHHNLGNYKEAIETYKNVLQSKPDWTGVHYNLGEAYLALGNRIDAFDQYMILKNLDSDLAHKLYRLFNLYNLDVCLGNA